MTIRVQTEDFDAGVEMALLRRDQPKVGAVACFVGIVRDLNEGEAVAQITLEHYPGMTEKALEKIVAEAKQRWDIFDTTVIHRIGTMQPTDQIVLVAVSSAHRGDAFQACGFLMDYLKTRAPFWKKEETPEGSRWVEARGSDERAAGRWT